MVSAVHLYMRERQTDRDTETDRQRHRDRQTDRDTHTQTKSCLLYTSDAADER